MKAKRSVSDAAQARTFTRELRRWCEHTGTHMDAKDGGSCEGCYDCDECMEAGFRRRVSGYIHRGRLRRMLVCSVCEQGYFKRGAFDAHECHDAY